MKKVKMFAGLLKEDLKGKLWLVLLTWYGLGMFCLLFAAKITIPAGEARSLYVGAGNTSFFTAMIIFGILMGIMSFPYLYSQKKADLYFSLPFSRNQLFLAGCCNNFLIFSIPLVVCKLIFFRLSLSMGYCKYEDSALSVWMSCIVLIAGWMLLNNLSMLSAFLTQNAGYMGGLLILFLFGPDWGFWLVEKMMKICIPTFYRSERLEWLKGYFSPFSLLKNAAGIDKYVDGSLWNPEEHMPYILFLAVAVVFLTILNAMIFSKRPVERRSRMFSFRVAEWIVRYICVFLAVLWFVGLFQIFAWGTFSPELAVFAIICGVPLVHGLLNALIACDIKKFVSGKWHLLAELVLMFAVLGVFVAGGRNAGAFPDKEKIVSMGVDLTALGSGDEPEEVLLNMNLTDGELSEAYEWVLANCVNGESLEGTGIDNYELLVKCRLKNGGAKYYKYEIPWYYVDEFGEIFKGEEFKEGMYAVLRLDSLKYYEISWSNGLETYMLDLNEEERQALWEIYRADFMKLAFSDIREQTPIGCLTFCSTKNQGDAIGYIYPCFTEVLEALSEYGIDGDKTIADYPINKIVIDKYLTTQGILYDVRYLEWEKETTDEGYIGELAKELYYKDFCVDYLLNNKNTAMEITVYYRDSSGKTVNRISCMTNGAANIY
ncbi:MAG: hypothetical protein HDR00_07355 [Lachnospiraceae bacterium]|nr:hypothetical protein [Lachnospiraceae bacterium]